MASAPFELRVLLRCARYTREKGYWVLRVEAHRVDEPWMTRSRMHFQFKTLQQDFYKAAHELRDELEWTIRAKMPRTNVRFVWRVR